MIVITRDLVNVAFGRAFILAVVLPVKAQEMARLQYSQLYEIEQVQSNLAHLYTNLAVVLQLHSRLPEMQQIGRAHV